MIKKLLKTHTYAVVIPILTLAFSVAMFLLAKLLIHWRPHLDMTTSWDLAVPFLPWTVVIYLGTFLFWYYVYVRSALQDRDKADRFFCTQVLTVLISFVTFLIVPTTNVRPEVGGPGFWNWVMRIVYGVDTPENLFPSLHCSTAWLCWVGLRSRKDISLRLKLFAFVLGVAVCVSTLTTRQHVIADAVVGVALCEIDWQLAGIPAIRRRFSAVADRIVRLFRKDRPGEAA